MDERLLAVKKTIESPRRGKTGTWGYDLLSTLNFHESWNVMQPQLRKTLNVVIPEKDLLDEKDTRNPFVSENLQFTLQIKDHLKSIDEHLEPMSIEEMVQDIEGFFKEGDLHD